MIICTSLDDVTCAPDVDNRRTLSKVHPCSIVACQVLMWFWFDSDVITVTISQVDSEEKLAHILFGVFA